MLVLAERGSCGQQQRSHAHTHPACSHTPPPATRREAFSVGLAGWWIMHDFRSHGRDGADPLAELLACDGMNTMRKREIARSRDPGTIRTLMQRTVLVLLIVSGILSGCSRDKPATYQGYVEGEYVHVASPIGGRLEHLLVQRGQTIE